MTNHDLAKIVETSDEWIFERTGIRQRHVAAEGEVSSDMALKASVRALEMARTRPEDLDCIIVGTISPDMPMPACAAFLQHKLGAKRAFAFDVSAACAGSLFGLSIGAQYVATGVAKRVLVVGVELLTRIIDWEDRNTCVLFGDAAGAVVLKADSEGGILSTHLHADGGKKELLYNPVGVSKGFEAELPNCGVKVMMAGSDVFKHAVKALDSVVDETLEANGLDKSDVDWLIPHQANLRIIEATAKRLQMPMERVIVTVDRTGNTSAGSVPLALDEAVRSGKVQRGQLLLLEAFGGGFTWGSALLRY
jgi:3-oxoacyl-[acyl-carrier-protein] synthase-3